MNSFFYFSLSAVQSRALEIDPDNIDALSNIAGPLFAKVLRQMKAKDKLLADALPRPIRVNLKTLSNR